MLRELNQSTIEWCGREESRLKADSDYWRNPLKAGRMMALWKIEAKARDEQRMAELMDRWPMARLVADWR